MCRHASAAGDVATNVPSAQAVQTHSMKLPTGALLLPTTFRSARACERKRVTSHGARRVSARALASALPHAKGRNKSTTLAERREQRSAACSAADSVRDRAAPTSCLTQSAASRGDPGQQGRARSVTRGAAHVCKAGQCGRARDAGRRCPRSRRTDAAQTQHAPGRRRAREAAHRAKKGTTQSTVSVAPLVLPVSLQSAACRDGDGARWRPEVWARCGAMLCQQPWLRRDAQPPARSRPHAACAAAAAPPPLHRHAAAARASPIALGPCFRAMCARAGRKLCGGRSVAAAAALRAAAAAHDLSQSDDGLVDDADGFMDFKAVVKLHCTTLEPDWVNPWQARVCACSLCTKPRVALRRLHGRTDCGGSR